MYILWRRHLQRAQATHKQRPPEEKYLKISIFRFDIRCTRCSSEITVKTDPKNMTTLVQRGSKSGGISNRGGMLTETSEGDDERG